MHAAERGLKAIVTLLLKHDADVELKDAVRNTLFGAAYLRERQTAHAKAHACVLAC